MSNDWSTITTPQERKQTAGKILPSTMVPWEAYDSCLACTSYCNLTNASRFLRDPNVTLRHLQMIGGCFISVMSSGCSPEFELSRVFEAGAKKYSRDSWRQGVNTNLLLQASWRHLNKYLDGETINHDDGECTHLGHALWQVVAAIWMINNNPEYVDTPGLRKGIDEEL